MTASFTIDTMGVVREPEIVFPLTAEQDSIAIEIIKKMPGWKAGKVRGRPTKMKYTVPIIFKDFNKIEQETGSVPGCFQRLQ